MNNNNFICETEYKTHEEYGNINLINKCIHFCSLNNNCFNNNKIYKIKNITKNYVYFYDLHCGNIFNEYIYNLTNKEFQFNIFNIRIKLKRFNLFKFHIVNNIEDYYFYNNKLCNNYKLIKNYIEEKVIKIEIYNFIYQINKIFGPISNLTKRDLDIYYKNHIDNIKNYENIIIEIGLYDDYMKIINYYKEDENDYILLNESCPVCLSDDVKVYEGCYYCNHGICLDCFRKWKKETCPFCRAISKTYIGDY